MIYLVDIGNTRLKYIALPCDITAKRYTCDGFDVLPTSVFAKDICNRWLSAHWGNASKIIIASVNQLAQVEMIITWAQKQNILIEHVTSAPVAHGVTSGYKVYSQLGVDRWLALIGAHHRYPNKSLIIIDAGTATTVDIITDKGFHKGGWIVPGVVMMQESIFSGTANVAVENRNPSSAFAHSTVDNVSNGCWAATLGLINLAIKQLQQLQVITLPNVIFTGGNGDVLFKMFNDLSDIKKANKTCITQLDSALIFYGLVQYLNDKSTISNEKTAK